jgi:hypothetical protein
VASRVRNIGNGEELSETLCLPREVARHCHGTFGMSHMCSADMVRALARETETVEFVPLPAHFREVGRYGLRHETCRMYWIQIAAYSPPCNPYCGRVLRLNAILSDAVRKHVSLSVEYRAAI